MPIYEKNKQIGMVLSGSKSSSDYTQYGSLGFPSSSKQLLCVMFAFSTNLILLKEKKKQHVTTENMLQAQILAPGECDSECV